MSAALIEQFDLLATSTGGIAKLRELILSLAVRGQLVPQDPNDEPASELLKKIRAEKGRLIAEGKIKRDKPLAEIGEDEKPYELPTGWEWVRLGDLLERLSNGYTDKQSKNETAFPVTRIETISKSVVDGSRVGYCDDVSAEDVEKYQLKAGDILLSHINSGLHVGKTAVFDGMTFLLHGTNLLLLRPAQQIDPKFVDVVINSLRLNGYFLAIAQHAIGQASINQSKVSSVLIPTPPLAEQTRIVAKVEELMALCDRLEAEQGHGARVQGYWVEAALDQLAESADADEFRSHWQHLAEHFDTLFTTPASIERLNATLLQLAVRGKLVAQDPSDQPASELLKKIRAEKDRLILEGKIKRDKPLPPITDDEKPYALPEGWEWVRLGTISEFTNGFAFPSGEFTNAGVGIVKIGDIQNGEVRTENMSYVSSDYAQQIDQCFQVRHGDMLIAMSGATTGKLGFNTTKQVFFLNQRVGKIEMCLTNVQFAYRYLNTKIAENLAISAGSAIPNISTVQIKEIEFPLPPLAEQSSIIAQLEQLLTLTAELRTCLTATQTKQAHLGEVLIQEALAV